MKTNIVLYSICAHAKVQIRLLLVCHIHTFTHPPIKHAQSKAHDLAQKTIDTTHIQ